VGLVLQSISYPLTSDEMGLKGLEFLPADRALCARSAGPKITLPFPRLYICISVYLCVRTYNVRDNYVTYIVAMRLYFSRPRQLRRLLCVAAMPMSSLPQLRLRDGYREVEAT